MEGLEGKTALITGGAGGIGSTICEALLESGGRVFLHDLPTSDGVSKARSLCQRFGDGRAIFVAGDLNDLPALARESAKLAAELEGFDFLVNNAAVDPVAPMEAYSIEDFLAVQTINAHAAFALCQALAPLHEAQERRRHRQRDERRSVGRLARESPLSKGALLGLTRSLARELGPHNIRVNAVSPGAIPTEMEHKHYAANGRAAYDQWAISKQSLPFRSDIRDVADTVVYLLSPLSRFMTGQELHVNGGMYMG